MKPQSDVLIVTVTPVESRAVMAAFKQATGEDSRPVTIENRVYHDLGEIAGTQVFMALADMGASQSAVQKGIDALRPNAVIMVGIAFGMNSSKQAIGDVLVSRQLVLYEPQRVGKNEIIPRGPRPNASPRLVNAMAGAYLYWEGAAKVQFGLVLSGEKLVDNLDFREQLQRQEPEAIGGDMEGAGLYLACEDAKVDWILVKAICDFADGNKAHDKGAQQQKAAQNAVEFVLHAIKSVWNKETKQSEASNIDDVSSFAFENTDFTNRSAADLPKEEIIATSISSITPVQIANDIYNRPLYQKEETAKSFIGLKIQWNLSLQSVKKASNILDYLPLDYVPLFTKSSLNTPPKLKIIAEFEREKNWLRKILETDDPDPSLGIEEKIRTNSVLIEFNITEKKCPKIKIARQGAKLTVIGTIFNVRDFGFLRIELSDVELDIHG